MIMQLHSSFLYSQSPMEQISDTWYRKEIEEVKSLTSNIWEL